MGGSLSELLVPEEHGWYLLVAWCTHLAFTEGGGGGGGLHGVI